MFHDDLVSQQCVSHVHAVADDYSHFSVRRLTHYLYKGACISRLTPAAKHGEGRAGSEALHGQDALAQAQREPNCQGQCIGLALRTMYYKYVICPCRVKNNKKITFPWPTCSSINPARAVYQRAALLHCCEIHTFQHGDERNHRVSPMMSDTA